MTMRRCARSSSPLRTRRTCGRCCAWCAHPSCAPSTMRRCGLRDTSCSILITISLGATPSPTYPGNRRKRSQPGVSACPAGARQHSTRWLKGFSAAQRSTCTRVATAAWTLQQLREVIGLQERYEYLLHDRDSIFASHLDESIAKLGVTVLKSPPRSPKANAVCERVIGTLRRECLDWLIALTESHLRTVLQSWVRHYNTGRPHMALGPGVPDPPPVMPHDAASTSHPRLRQGRVVRAGSILGGLHHEYFWAPAGAH